MSIKGYNEWIKFADEDLWAANIAFDNKHYSLCVAHSHDAVEKILKAVMLKNHMDIERIHVINRITAELIAILPVLSNFSNEISDMDYYYMPSRYPSMIVIDKETAERQLNTAKIIYDESMNVLNR